jgi:hypothetical protein
MSEEQRLEQRLGAWGATPLEAGDWMDVLRRAGERPVVRRFSRRRLAFALAAVVVLVGGSLAAAFFVDRSGSAPTGPLGPGKPGDLTSSPPDGSNPWGQWGRQITIDELRAEAPYIPLPNSELANDGNVGTVWVWDHTSDPTLPEGHVAAAVFYPGSGIELLWTGSGLDYTGLRPGEEQTIDGVQAIILAGDQSVGPTGATGYNFPAVSVLNLPVGPNHVLQMDGTVPGSELIDVARTLSPSPGNASPTGDLPPADPQPGPYLTAWGGLLSGAVSPDSVYGAAGSLPFQPVAPSSLGDPSEILETDPDGAAPSDRVLSLRYDDPSKGRFWLLERPSLYATTSLLREIATDCTRATGCKAEVVSMVDLAKGVSGLNLEDPVTERIVWVENGVYFEAVGNASTFTATDALTVAKTVAGS